MEYNWNKIDKIINKMMWMEIQWNNMNGMEIQWNNMNGMEINGKTMI